MTYNRNDDDHSGRRQPSETLGPVAFIQRLLLKRSPRRLTCPLEMAHPVQPSATAERGKRRPPIKWQDDYGR
jgi:hypothetical protein